MAASETALLCVQAYHPRSLPPEISVKAARKAVLYVELLDARKDGFNDRFFNHLSGIERR
jgi:hypothetical protein